MIHILQDRAKGGVEIRVIGQTEADLPVRKLAKLRLHTRIIVRDGHQAFIGSQSLRSAELDSRREVGLIVRDSKIVKKLIETFESDWASSGSEKQGMKSQRSQRHENGKRIRRSGVLIEELHPITTTVEKGCAKGGFSSRRGSARRWNRARNRNQTSQESSEASR